MYLKIKSNMYIDVYRCIIKVYISVYIAVIATFTMFMTPCGPLIAHTMTEYFMVKIHPYKIACVGDFTSKHLYMTGYYGK